MRRNARLFLLAGFFVTLGISMFVSPLASSSPDGLERVATEKGFVESAKDHAFEDSPVADYSAKGVDNPSISTGIAGLIGVLITFGVGLALFGLLRIIRARE
jgi:cobalt/nickel transport protein